MSLVQGKYHSEVVTGTELYLLTTILDLSLFLSLPPPPPLSPFTQQKFLILLALSFDKVSLLNLPKSRSGDNGKGGPLE